MLQVETGQYSVVHAYVIRYARNNQNIKEVMALKSLGTPALCY